MSFENGHPKYGGRQKGTPNKFTKELSQVCEELGFNPFEALVQMAQDPELKPGVKLGALKELCEYLFPKRRRMEFDGSEFLGIVREIQSLSQLSTDELKKIALQQVEKGKEE